MKKLIAISVLFALLVTAVFAETSVGGNMKISTALLKGQSGAATDDPIVQSGPVVFWDGHVNVNFGDAKAGGMMRLWTKTNEWQPDWFAFWWWRPNEYFRMQLGKDPDAFWGTAQITGWGYNQEAQGGIAYDQHRGANGTASIVARTAGFAPGREGPGLALSGFLLDNMLTLNLFIPFGGAGATGSAGGFGGSDGSSITNGSKWQEVYTKMYANVIYKLEEIGDIRLTAAFGAGDQLAFDPIKDANNLAKGNKPEYRWRGDNEEHDPTKIYGSFYLTAIENMAVDIGLAAFLPYTTQKAKWVFTDAEGDGDQTNPDNWQNVGGQGVGTPQGTTVFSDFEVGLGYRFSSGDFAIKVRTGATFGGGKKLLDEKKARAAVDLDPGLSALYLLPVSFKQIEAAPTGGTATNPAATKYVRTYSATTGETKNDFTWGFGILPSYKVSNVTIFLNAGLGIRAYGTAEAVWYEGTEKKTKTVSTHERVVVDKPIITKMSEYNAQNNDMKGVSILTSDFDWFINPYVRIPAGSGQFYAGFKLFADGTKVDQKFAWNVKNDDGTINTTNQGKSTGYTTNVDVVKWEIPIGWNFYF